MRVFIMHRSKHGFLTYIPERHFHLIRDRFKRGEKVVSLLYPLTRAELAKIILAESNACEEV